LKICFYATRHIGTPRFEGRAQTLRVIESFGFMNIYKVMLRDRRDEVVEANHYRREGEQYVFECDGDPDVRFFLVSEVIGIDLLPGKIRTTGGGSY
jgi:hypothetical protein